MLKLNQLPQLIFQNITLIKKKGPRNVKGKKDLSLTKLPRTNGNII